MDPLGWESTGSSFAVLLLLQSMGSKHAGFSSCVWIDSVVAVHRLQSMDSVAVVLGLSCPMACELQGNYATKHSLILNINRFPPIYFFCNNFYLGPYNILPKIL